MRLHARIRRAVSHHKAKLLIHLAAFALAVLTVITVPAMWCGRHAGRWTQEKSSPQLQFSRGVEEAVLKKTLSDKSFKTGSDQFSGEWLFGSYLMAGIGFAQIALQHDRPSDRHERLTRECIERILTRDVQTFDKNRWGEFPLQGIDSRNDHAAYLGYLNFLLGLYQIAFHKDTFADLNERITTALVRGLRNTELDLLESYPGEMYPVDNCFVVSSIALYQRVSDEDYSAVIDDCTEHLRNDYMHAESKLLFQCVDPADGTPGDAPRGSGSALALLPLHYADPGLARTIYDGIRKTLAGNVCGFAGVQEYPRGYKGGGDIDSGPIVFGYGCSATGFTIGGAKRYGDKRFFRRLWATANLVGAPVTREDRRRFITGGPLGNAILLAMVTVPTVNE